MIVSCAQMLELESSAFSQGVSAEKLMDQAGLRLFEIVRQFFPQPSSALLYLGKGNNAGDALVLARHLLSAGWKVHARLVMPAEDFGTLPAAHWEKLHPQIPVLTGPSPLETQPGSLLLVDGLLGIGAKPRILSGSFAEAVEEMNALRRRRHALTLAIDLPSGLNTQSGKVDGPCVEADLTVTIAFAKEPLLSDDATRVVGRLAVAPLPDIAPPSGAVTARVLTSAALLPTLPCRSFDFHKGSAGRVGIIAGSRGYVGAAVMSAAAALRGGAGLITLYVQEQHYPLFAAQTPPEIMVRPVADYRAVLEEKHDVLAIGPGLGRQFESQVLEVIRQADAPLVLDADALNIIAASRLGLAALKSTRRPVLLTPHPGEMARLIKGLPEFQGLDRAALVAKLTAAYPRSIWLLKGSRTVIAAKDRPLSFNTTGHPGMATGGMGDVLTGLSAALAGQGLDLYDAACLGAWLSGRAAEIALLNGQSQESFAPSDLLAHLGAAFTDLKRLAY